MVKIDTINFGVLMARIATITGNELYHGTVCDLHTMVRDCVVDDPPQILPGVPDIKEINMLVEGICKGEKITAIKAYRVITGYGLKEAKDAVELHWVNKPEPVISFTRKHLYEKLNNKSLPMETDKIIYDFIADL